MSHPGTSPTTETTSSAARSSASQRTKPRASLAIATAFGLGYLPKAPGTFGSLGGVALAALYWFGPLHDKASGGFARNSAGESLWIAIAATILVSAIGVPAATSTANFLGRKDPQIVVIDEVSGQMISYFGIGAAAPNWKYLLLGFILFRVFDIWKPFPARQAESLPGGWGIMADDWIAGVYAALVLCAARGIGF